MREWNLLRTQESRPAQAVRKIDERNTAQNVVACTALKCGAGAASSLCVCRGTSRRGPDRLAGGGGRARLGQEGGEAERQRARRHDASCHCCLDRALQNEANFNQQSRQVIM